jgi:hypothetical protein
MLAQGQPPPAVHREKRGSLPEAISRLDRACLI